MKAYTTVMLLDGIRFIGINLVKMNSTITLPTINDPQTICFAKDHARRYLAGNGRFAHLLGLESATDIAGRSTPEFFGDDLVDRYDELDAAVASGMTFVDRFDQTANRFGEPIWWLYSRTYSAKSETIIGISRELPRFAKSDTLYARLSQTTERIANTLSFPLSVKQLAEEAGCSVSQLDRDFTRILGVSPTHYQSRLRVQRAKDLIRDGMRFSEIAFDCGFADQSAFNRRFKAVTGLTPGEHRTQVDATASGH